MKARRRTKKYAVTVYGRNFRLLWEERKKTVTKLTGFYTTRYVEASDSVDAEYKAIDLIRGDARLRRSVRNAPGDPPIMDVVRIRDVDSFSPFKKAGQGFAFFHGRGAGRPRTLKLARPR